MTYFGSGSTPALLSLLVLLTVLVLSVQTSHGFRSGMKVWRENTNFGNARNWEGLVDENCSQNIFSFPGWMDPSVVAFPSTFIGKQIIMPVNGHFVFQPGLTTLSDSGTCQHGREVKFRRTTRVDWFDPQNWITSDSNSENPRINRAVPHVERVPCQYDAVKFPSRSTFNLLIPQNIAIAKFFLGDEEKSYRDIAVMMSSKLGMLQFKKSSEVEFKLTNVTCSDSDDQCLCDNYKASIRSKICSLSQCTEEECHNSIQPHGFCCPICGFHITIRHNGELKLAQVEQKLKEMVNSAKLTKGVEYHVSRYQVKRAHVIIIPKKNSTGEAIRISRGIVKYLTNEPQVGDVTWNGSWEDIPSDVDKWASEGLNGGIITLIVILILSFLIGIACFILYRRSNGTHPPFTFANLVPNFTMPNMNMPSFASMQMPNINIPIPGRSGSTQAGGRTFGFARFTNDRISTVNIERRAGNLERGEQVDESINPIDAGVPLEKVTDASTDFGFTNVTYDIIGVTESPSTTELVNNPFESDFEPRTATSANTMDIEEPQRQQQTGPVKPSRSANAVKNEPIYDEVIEVCDDTSPILLPEFAPQKSEE